MRRKLVVFGDRTANEIVESAEVSYRERFEAIVRVYYDPSSFSSSVADEEAKGFDEIVYHVGIADVELKRQIDAECARLDWQPFTIIDRTAVIAPSAMIGKGVFIGPLAVVSTNATVGDGAIVHIHSSIGHDAIVEPLCFILPGARVSGSVHIGERSLVGSNAFIAAGVKIGADCQVDAMTYVRRDLPPGHLQSIRSAHPLKRVGFPPSGG